MHRAVQIMALWLAAVWLPLTMHCQLADCLADRGPCDKGSDCCQAPSGCGGDDCHLSLCKTIENGKFLLADHSVAVPPAAFHEIGWPGFLDFRRLWTPERTLSEATGAPPGTPRTWQFVFRAAASPRAPSALC